MRLCDFSYSLAFRTYVEDVLLFIISQLPSDFKNGIPQQPSTGFQAYLALPIYFRGIVGEIRLREKACAPGQESGQGRVGMQ
jgi:hypothetical protein